MTKEQGKWLKWLSDMGGSGYVDRYGRIVAGGQVAAQGASVSWLKLLSYGFIEGGSDRIEITRRGRDRVQDDADECIF